MKLLTVPFDQAQQNESISVTGTAWTYGLIVLAISFAAAIVVSIIYKVIFTKISSSMGYSIGSMSLFAGTYVGAYIILHNFCKKHGRLFTRQEYRKVTKLGALANVLYCLPIMLLTLFTKQIPITPAILIIVAAFVLQFLVVWWFSCIGFKQAIRTKARIIQAKQPGV